MVGESDVFLDKDIIPDKAREFFPTIAEWVADGNAEQIIASAIANGVMFTVPDNFTLFITSAFISDHTESTGADNDAQIQVRDETRLILATNTPHSHTGGNNHEHCCVAQTYPMPIKVESGATIEFRGLGAGAHGTAGIQGFLLPKKISIR